MGFYIFDNQYVFSDGLFFCKEQSGFTFACDFKSALLEVYKEEHGFCWTIEATDDEILKFAVDFFNECKYFSDVRGELTKDETKLLGMSDEQLLDYFTPLYYRDSIEIPSAVHFENRSLPVTGFDGGIDLSVRSLVLPDNMDFVSGGSYEMFLHSNTDIKLTVKPTYKFLCERDGMIYSKDFKKLIFCSRDKAGDVVIPDDVETIGAFAFYWCEKITSVTVSKNVSKIFTHAFAVCSSLKKVIFLNQKPLLIGSDDCKCDSMFCACHELEEVDYGVNTYMFPSMFSDCYNLKSFYGPQVKNMDIRNAFREYYGYFSGCNALEKIVLSEGTIDRKTKGI